MAEMKKDVVIVGGGVAGTTAALVLGKMGYEVALFERKESLIGGPPFCHLHAGGNLYREISDEQCLTLLRQSIEFARLYPFIVDRRPTVVAIPTRDPGEPNDLLPRLKRLQKRYEALVEQDPANGVLGEPQDYFRLYDEADLRRLRDVPPPDRPQTPDEWMIPFAKSVDLKRLKFPVVLVREFGLNLFRLAGGAMLQLRRIPTVSLRMNRRVCAIERVKEGFAVYDDGGGRTVCDYLINAAGFRTGEIDDMLGLRARRMVEFKAAYTARWPRRHPFWPEVIFHGQRGTPEGMGQFTPYPAGFVQLHAMTPDMTLFEGGLVVSTPQSSQPKLPETFLKMIDEGWPEELVNLRTRRAIDYLARWIPDFSEASVGGPPLFGAQQIPGDDPTLRVAEVAFATDHYARCEIVKVSSVTDMMRAIVKDLNKGKPIDFAYDNLIDRSEKEIAAKAEEVALSRGFSREMAHRLIE